MTMTAIPEMLDFSGLEPVLVKLKLGKDNYLIQEASGGASATYKNAITNNIKYEKGEPVSANNMADAEYLLISQCLLRANVTVGPDGKEVWTPQIVAGKPSAPALQTIRSWPHRVTKRIFDTIKGISDLQDDENAALDELRKRRDKLDELIKQHEQGTTRPKETSTPTEDSSS